MIEGSMTMHSERRASPPSCATATHYACRSSVLLEMRKRAVATLKKYQWRSGFAARESQNPADQDHVIAAVVRRFACAFENCECIGQGRRSKLRCNELDALEIVRAWFRELRGDGLVRRAKDADRVGGCIKKGLKPIGSPVQAPKHQGRIQ